MYKRHIKICEICGIRYHGVSSGKYCPICRQDIARYKGRYKGQYKTTADALKLLYIGKKRCNFSINEVVNIAKENNKSYGYMVAELEGRT